MKQFIRGLMWVLLIVVSLIILIDIASVYWWVAPLGLVACGIDGYGAYICFANWYRLYKINKNEVE